MNQGLSWLLFDGSPFRPSPSASTIKRIVFEINERKVAPGLATAIEVVMVGTVVHELHEKSFDYLAYQYNLDAVNLTHYLFGFTTPPTLLTGAYLSNILTLKDVVQKICLASKDEVLIELNQYKAHHLVKAIEIFQTAQSRHPLFSAIQIYKLCRENPFVLDPYFLLGLEASELLFKDIIGSLQIEKPN